MSIVRTIKDWFLANAAEPARGTLDATPPQPSGVVPDQSPANPINDPALSLGNPLFNLQPDTVAGMFEDALRGQWLDIQWLLEWILRCDPHALALSTRREAALARLDWSVKVRQSNAQRGIKVDDKLAADQAAALNEYYYRQDNLPQVYRHLASAVFAGYAQVYRCADGRLKPLKQFWFLRDGMNGAWYYNPDANHGTYANLPATARLQPGQWLVWERERSLLFVAVLCYLRSAWSNRWWDKFCEAVSKLGIVIVGPPGLATSQLAKFEADAKSIGAGGSGVLPNGSSVEQTNASRGAAPFGARLEDLRASLVIAATGGMLTSLAAPTGMGSGVADVQDAVFDSIVGADAMEIAGVFQAGPDRDVLAKAFPGRPRLAYFELARPEAADTPMDLADLDAKLSTAGRRIAQAELEEAIGHKLEVFAAPAAPAAPPPPPAKPAAALANAAADVTKHTTPAAAAPAELRPPPLPSSWSAPVAAAVKDIADLIAAGGSPDDVRQHIADLTQLMGSMDHDALANVLADAMTQAMAAGMAAEIRDNPAVAAKWLAPASASVSEPAIPAALANAAPAAAQVSPIQGAVEKLLGKALAPSAMGSADWAAVPTDIRNASFFSARVESASLLQEMKDRLEKALQLAVNDQGAFTDRSAFIREMRSVLEQSGFELSEGGEGSITDLTSPGRLGLIYDTQTNMATEFARHQMHQDPDVLDAYPARELLRLETRMVPRNWIERWRAAGGRVYQGRMVAPVNDPIWSAISAFGNPYPPFDYGSGMGVLDLSAAEAASLGVPTAGQAPQPTAFAAQNRASVSDLDRETLLALRNELRGQSAIAQGQITWEPQA